MAKMEAGFIQERAQQLAIIYLTRRENARVTPGRNPSDPSLLASLLNEGRDTGLCLGVEVAGTVSEIGLKREGETIDPGTNVSAFRDTPYPVCLFYFTMHDDAGYWKWLREPTPDGQRLLSEDGGILIRLTNQALNDIWTSVEQWHRMQQQLVAA